MAADVSQSLGDAVGIGVLTGVASSVLMSAAIVFFRKVMMPWYEGVIYKGIEIAGEWSTTETPFEKQVVRLSLRQHANQLTGIVTYTNLDTENGAKEKLRVFTATGDVSERFVCLRLRQRDRRRIGVVHYLLEVAGDGRTMRGWSTYYHLTEEVVAGAKISFELIGAEALH